ncbi:MAG: hypothetical protein JNM07_12115 [Phycisphaerae bacterium]|nr:hypothetical protein [Phycisphaerae bacterium]
MRDRTVRLLAATLGILAGGAASRGGPPDVGAYNLVWSSPTPLARGAAGSMPIGNGMVGANVWVEEDGDLVLLLSRADAWSETDRLLKLGRIRVHLEPNPFIAARASGGSGAVETAPFRQELNLREGRIDITAGARGAADRGATIRVFVDARSPTVRIEGECAQPTTIVARLESWRRARKDLENDDELRSSWTMHSAPAEVRRELAWESPDVIIPVAGSRAGITWYHRNEHSVVPFTLTRQGLDSIKGSFKDPLLGRTFGGRMGGDGFIPLAGGGAAPDAIATDRPVRSFGVRIVTHGEQTPRAADWLVRLDALDAAEPPATIARERTASWWRAFWDRSWIFVSGDPSPARPHAVPINNHPVRIGADSKNDNVFRGAMRDLEIWSVPLDHEQVAALASAPLYGGTRAPEIPVPWYYWTPRGGRPARGTDPCPVTLKPDGAVEDAAAAPDLASLVFRGGHFVIAPSDAPEFDRGLSVSASLLYLKDLAPARIVDKMTPGGADGFIFDTHPGDALRLIVGDFTLHAEHVLTPDMSGAAQHVAATYDANTGRGALYLNGKRIKEGGPAWSDPAPASRVTQAYALQRYVSACGGRGGDYPIKFNGSIFTVEPAHAEGQRFDPDWRKWGGCFWWQNTRLPYYPMLAAGDLDLMDPLFRFFENALEGSRARARLYYGAEGVYFPETITTFGTYGNGDYGWNRENLASGDISPCPWWQWAWNQSLELSQLMLDYAAYSGDAEFLRGRALPMANATLRYFDSRFARDDNGKFLVTPTQAVETYWHEVVNDAPVVGGLRTVCDQLLALPDSVGAEDERRLWRRVREAAPALPVWEQRGVRMAAPAERFKNQRSNVETPELYPLWPFREYGLGKPGLDLAINAFRARANPSTVGWTQDGIFAARLGLAEDARANLLARTRNSHPNFRFPATWGPNFDWLPDQCHGGNLMSGLQQMLLQCDPVTGEIRLLPAWPREWNVSFKLHAPGRTTVECEYRDGKVQRLTVSPETRRGDIRFPSGD